MYQERCLTSVPLHLPVFTLTSSKCEWMSLTCSKVKVTPSAPRIIKLSNIKRKCIPIKHKKKYYFGILQILKKNFTRNFKHNGISDSQQYSLNLWPIMDDRDDLNHGFPLIVTFVDFKLQTQIFFIVTIKQRLIGYYCESDMPRSIT